MIFVSFSLVTPWHENLNPSILNFVPERNLEKYELQTWIVLIYIGTLQFVFLISDNM